MSDSPTHHLSDSLMLDEHDINEFGMSHSPDEYATNNFEEVEYQDLDCTNEEVMTTEETIIMERSDNQLMEHIEIDNDPDQEAEHDIIQQLQRESDEGIEHEYDNHEIEYETDEVEAALDPEFDAEIEANEEQDDVEMTEPCHKELIEEGEIEEEEEEEEVEGQDGLDELEADEISSPQVSYTNSSNQNKVFQAKPTFQKISTPNISVKPISSQSSQSQTFMIVSDGQRPNQLLKISHPSGASQGQLQSIAQSIITAKSADGNIIHLRSAQTGKPLVATSQGSNVTVQNVQNPKIMTNTIKRTIQNTNQQQNRNLYTKMLISSGNQQGQEIYVPANSKDNQHQQQPFKYYTTTSSSGNDNTNSTKSMSINQSQMGYVVQQQQQPQQQQQTVSKVPNIMPMTTTPKQYVYSHKIGQSTTQQPPKLSVIPVKSLPTKILPAPIMTTQIRPSNSQQMQFTTAKNSSQQNPHKVFIRQSSLKPGVFGSGQQVIRIPSNQNIINSNQVHQIQQIPGSKQVQLVRIVNSSSSSSSSSPSTSKPKTQTMGVTQRMGCVPQQLVKVVPINASNQQQLRQVAPKTIMSGTQRILIPATSMNVSGQNKNTVGIPASRINQLTSGQTILSTNSNVGNIVVLSSGFVQQQQQQQQNSQNQQHKPLKHRSTFTPPPKDFLDPNKSTTTTTTPTNIYKSLSPKNSSSSMAGNLSTTSESSLISAPSTPTPKSSKTPSSPLDSNGNRQRKPCNCTKSQCLKLYCDCFANGEFCNSCNCTNCSNNLVNEEERQKAIKLCLERNPNAFRPKIGKARESGDDIRRHNKGCNCKRSGCLKNYCECYEAKIACSGNCKCIGCRNVEEPVLQDDKALKDLADAAEARTTQIMMDNARMRQFPSAFRPSASSNTGLRQPFHFLTDKVIESTCQCLLAQAEDAERGMFDEETSQRLIIEEFGRCFKEIIETAQKVESTNT